MIYHPDTHELAMRMLRAGVTSEQLLTLVDDDMMVECVRDDARRFACEQQLFRRHYHLAKGAHISYCEPRNGGKWAFLVHRDLTVRLHELERWLAGREHISIADPPELPVTFVSQVVEPEPIPSHNYRRALWTPGDFYIYLET